MFAPPICRRRRRNDATGNTARYQDAGRFAGSDEDGGSLANIAASGASNRYSARGLFALVGVCRNGLSVRIAGAVAA
jgi:hypothetical protein